MIMAVTLKIMAWRNEGKEKGLVNLDGNAVDDVADSGDGYDTDSGARADDKYEDNAGDNVDDAKGNDDEDDEDES